MVGLLAAQKAHAPLAEVTLGQREVGVGLR